MTKKSRASTAVAAAVLSVACLSGCSPADVVATVDERPVTTAELEFHLALEAPAVDNQVAQGALAADAATQELRRRALDAAVDDAVLFELAHSSGVIGYDDYAGMLDELERENTARAEAVAAGEIVYGVTRFEAPEFYSRAVTNMRLGLIAELGAPDGPLAVSDAEVVAEYESDPSAWAAGVAEFEVRVVDVPGAALDAGACAAALEAAQPDDALSACAGASSSPASLNGAAPPPSGSPASQVLAAAQSVEVGETAAAIPLGDGTALVELLERRVDPDLALATYRERIRAQLIEGRLDADLDERVREAVVTVDRSRLDSIPTEGSK